MRLSRCANAHPPVYLGVERTTLLSVNKWVPALWTGAHLGVPEINCWEFPGKKREGSCGRDKVRWLCSVPAWDISSCLRQAKHGVALSGQDCKDIAESSYRLLRSGLVSSRVSHPYTCNSKSVLSGRSQRHGRSWCEYLPWLAKERQSFRKLLRRRDVLILEAAEESCPRGSACLDS